MISRLIELLIEGMEWKTLFDLGNILPHFILKIHENLWMDGWIR